MSKVKILQRAADYIQKMRGLIAEIDGVEMPTQESHGDVLFDF